MQSALKLTPSDKINEIRLRINRPIVLSINTKNYFLSGKGLCAEANKAIIATREIIDGVFKRTCENSVYAYNDQIKSGYITIKGGARIGITGEVVMEKGFVKTIKNISSLAVRIPHEVKGCALSVFDAIFGGGFKNTLIISPPGMGKTTLIRDILLQMSNRNYCYNTLLVDERFEIANCFDGVPTLDVGNFADILSGGNKLFAFENGVRAMKPDIIVTDELVTYKDCEAVAFAVNSGVGVLASVHAKKPSDLESKREFENLIKDKVFERYIVLSASEGAGTVEGIYDKNLRLMPI